MKERISILLALGGALLVLIACGTAVGGPRTQTTTNASVLDVTISIFHQFSEGSRPGYVDISMTFADTTGTVALSGEQQMTCDGIALNGQSITIGRQPAKGGYTCVYTDDQGKQTTLLVPAPQGLFAVTDPLPYAMVAVPVSAKPVPTTPFTGSQRPSEYTSMLRMQYRFPPLPQGATAKLMAYAWSSNPGPGIIGADEPATGAYDLSDAQAEYGIGFEAFQPGYGSLELNATITWPALHQEGFHSVKVQYFDSLSIPVQWS